jgi:hypothetical protein
VPGELTGIEIGLQKPPWVPQRKTWPSTQPSRRASPAYREARASHLASYRGWRVTSRCTERPRSAPPPLSNEADLRLTERVPDLVILNWRLPGLQCLTTPTTS